MPFLQTRSMSDPEEEAVRYNRSAWDAQVRRGNRWTVPASPDEIRAAREGRPHIVLTPVRPIPTDWWPPLRDAEVLALAAGGGQQAPLLAATGARVTVLDQSPEQLRQDRETAARENLSLRIEQGDMRDLTRFDDASFDLVVHPASVSFIPDPTPVWAEVHRILRPGGVYLLGACNPLLYLFDESLARQGRLEVRHRIPYSDLDQLTREELAALREGEEPLCFGHSLETLIGGQLAAGFELTGFYEDRLNIPGHPVDAHIPSLFATRARKPR
jgi:SAM-dependent methyltransferase